MSYTINRGGKDYTFENQAKYEEFYNQAKETAKRHGVSTADVFRTQYASYTDSAVEVPSTVTNVAPANASTVGIQPNYTNQQSVDTSIPTATDVYAPLLANAEQYKSDMYSRANNLRNASYAEATRAREEAERLAEVQRKRGIVDASTMAAQQKATYGANAEALGRSGLNVSGYSDYLNSQAYATGMAYRQAANAQATEANRQASYQEALARLEADKINAQSKAEADKTYYGLLNEIETAKIADAQQKQTNYQEFLASIPEGATTDQINAIADIYGITDEDEINKGINYAKAMGLTINDGSTTDTTPTVNEDAVAKVFSHQEGDETVVNAEYQVKDEYKNAKELHDKGEMDDATWRVIEGTYKMEYDNVENYVSVYSQTYDDNSFGKFASGKDQTKMLDDIIGMVEGKVLTNKGEKLKEGDEILVNVGRGTQKSYEYLGNGLFKETKFSKQKSEYVVPEDFVSTAGYVKKTTGIINVKEESAVKKFGSYAGSTNPSSAQSKYINQIIEDAKNGKIEKGEKVIANYGTIGSSKNYVFEYKGNGIFIHHSGSSVGVYDKNTVYVPEGYHLGTAASDGQTTIQKDN